MNTKTVEALAEDTNEQSGNGEFSVSDELYQISEATNSDGTVDVDVYDFTKIGDEKVKVKFRTPSRERKSEVMEWPRKDSPEYKFVRLCRATVGGLNGADWIKQDGSTIKADPDDWSIVAELSRTQNARHNISTLTVGEVLRRTGKATLLVYFLTLLGFAVGLPIYGVMTLAGWVAALAMDPLMLVLVSVLCLFVMGISFGILDDNA